VTGENRRGKTALGRHFTWKTSAFVTGEVLSYSYGCTALFKLKYRSLQWFK